MCGFNYVGYNKDSCRNYNFRTRIVLLQKGSLMLLRTIQAIFACVLLALTLSCNTSGSPTQTVPYPVSMRPTARASIQSPVPYFSEIPVLFDASESIDNDKPGNGKLKFEWEWESGTGFSHPESNSSTEHVWLYPGTYEVNLRVTDDEGETDTLDTPLIVEILDGALPYAKAGSSTDASLIFEGIEFYDDGSFTVIGTPIILFEWDWDFDGIYDEEGENVSHYWPEAGLYSVGYRVTTATGKTAELTEPLEIQINDVELNPVKLLPGWAQMHIADYFIRGPYIYVLDYYGIFAVFDITNLQQPVPLGYLYLDETPTTMVDESNLAYLFEELSDQAIQVIDISDPGNLFVSEVLEGTERFRRAAIKDGYLYGISASRDLYVIDVRPTPNHGALKLIDDTFSAELPGISGDYLHVIDTGDEAHIYDISDPWNPEFIQTFQFDELGNILVDPLNDYVFGLTESAIQVYKIGSTSLVTEFDPGFTSWIMNGILSDDGNYLYMATRNNISVIDTTNIESLSIVRTVDASLAIGKFNIQDKLLFAYSVYSDMMYIFDITAPPTMFQVAFFESLTFPQDVLSLGDYTFVADRGMGLRTLDTSETTNTLILDRLDLPQRITDLRLDGNILLALYIGPSVSVYELPFFLIDITNPAEPALVYSTDLDFDVIAVAMSDGYAYFGDKSGTRIEIWDIDPPASAHKVNEFNTSDYIYSIIRSGDYLYVATDGGIEIIDIADPLSPVPVTVLGDNLCRDLEIFSDRLFVLMRSGYDLDLITADIADPKNPTIVGRTRVGNFEFNVYLDIVFSRGYVFISRYGTGVDCFDVQPPETPEHVLIIEEETCNNLDVHENILYTVSRNKGLRRFELW